MNGLYTKNSKIKDVIKDSDFKDYGRLIFPVDSSYYSGNTLGDLRLVWYSNIISDTTVEIVNYMKEHANTVFYDIYTDKEKEKDPDKKQAYFSLRENPMKNLRFVVQEEDLCM